MIRLEVNIATQRLEVKDGDQIIREYVISTAKNGAGEEFGSYQTPRGLHIIRAKIGAGSPLNSIFVKRRPTGEIYVPEMSVQFPERDWILTRILWLSGLEVGKNRLGRKDTMRRYIYLHGAPHEAKLGTPVSKGCINMRNSDIIELFDTVSVHTRVLIKEDYDR